MKLELRKFDMKTIQFKPMLLGKRDTGMSFLVRDLLYYQQHKPIETVISGEKK